ncbi:hypothetical protein [Desulfotignum phosphitoxidans]|uniref:hypothetical protein n=1 Tax=Desulfotignum phosphitoxidans TaxID=190898 RepID=UPI000348CFD9|nr:hypothetical protein [Desulfotignum phosphitoxidans]
MVAVFFIRYGNQDDLYLGRDFFIRLPPEESVGLGWLRCILSHLCNCEASE